MKSILINEIRDGRLNFKIDEDTMSVIKNKDYSVTYLAVLQRACELIARKNMDLSNKVLNEKINEDARNSKMSDIIGGMGMGLGNLGRGVGLLD